MPVRTRKRLYGPRLPEEYNWTSITKPHNGDVYENTLTGDLYTCIDADEPNDAISWYIMPLPGSIPTVDGVVVSGAGTAEANGDPYLLTDTDGTGRSIWNITGTDPVISAVSYAGTPGDDGAWYVYAANGDPLYGTAQSDAFSPSGLTFSAMEGDSPAPTVTAQYLTLTGLPYGYTILGPGGFEMKFIGAAGTESDAGSWVAAPKVYKALLTQSGTVAPVANVLQNTLGGTVVWGRNDIGQYIATLADAFTANKTWLAYFNLTSTDDNTIDLKAFFTRALVGELDFNVYIQGGAYADLWTAGVEIEVYPA